MKRCYVGFDTSNYTTSAAICSEDGQVIANLKRPLAVGKNERGLRQSDAVFAHIKNLPELCREIGELIGGVEIAAVGVSSRPRSVEGSYMPCFLSGVAAANAFASAAGAPLYEYSHQDVHVMAAMYSADCADKLIGKPFVAFHVSGGTTEALLARPDADPFSLTLVGQTEDINAGQLIDRVGVMLGLDFPCGAALERLAAENTRALPTARTSVHSREVVECNLSGAENMAKRLYEQTEDKSAVAAFVFDFVGRTLCDTAGLVLDKYGDMPVLFAGGVMSNKLMRNRLSARCEAYFAEPEFSADNAAGIALLCRRRATEN